MLPFGPQPLAKRFANDGATHMGEPQHPIAATSVKHPNIMNFFTSETSVAELAHPDT